MAENDDYEEVLSGTVSEAKDNIRDLEEPDYRRLLQLERENKDRKTLKEWVEERLEEAEEPAEEEVIESVAEQQPIDASKMLMGGAIVGLIIGLSLGYWFAGAYGASADGFQTSDSQVRSSMQDLFDATGTSPNSIDVTRSNGMFHVVVNSTSDQGNQTRQVSRTFYVSPDGVMLFRARGPLGQPTVYNIEDLTNRLQQRDRNTTSEQTRETTNSTTS